MTELEISGGVAAGRRDESAAEVARAFFALLKPRVMSLVVFTGWVGLFLAPGHYNHALGAVAILCIAVGAGASGAINMWFDADIDAVMARTMRRPIPAGQVSAEDALTFGVCLSILAVMIMGLFVNWVAAALLAFTILFYVFVYTMWLKRRTPQNIVIGGAAGALPPVIGWAAVTGDVGAFPLLLFAIIFFWTPPHFWALSLYRSDDYARAGVPMLPVVAGPLATRRQIWLYTLLVVALGVAPWPLGFAGAVYGVGAVLLGLGFLGFAWPVFRRGDEGAARRLFGFSIAWLFLLFALLPVDRLVGG